MVQTVRLTPLLIGFSAITVNFLEKIDLSIRSKNVFNKYILSILIFFIFISVFSYNIGMHIPVGLIMIRMAEKQGMLVKN